MSNILKFASVFLIFSFIFLLIPADVFGTTAGPNSPNTITNDSSVGTINWTSLNNVKTSNNQYATTANMDSGNVTVYLKATNFGFSIPAGVTIDGISVNVERKANDANFFDNAIRIVKGGTIGTSDKSRVDAWPTSDGTVTYGGVSDLWGQSWTYADINSANFGFAISAKKVGGNKNKNPSIDWINITITYHTPTPPTVTISAAPTTITLGQSSTLTWSSTNATSCSASGDWNGSKSTSGSESFTPGSTGTKTYTLSCSGADGSASNSAMVAVNNPVPTTTSISPTSKTIGDDQFIMTVNGTNFINGSTVRFNGSDRATTYFSPTQLTAIIPIGDMTTAGTFNITVFNAAPGGGTSNAQVFTVNAITIGTVNLDGYLINPSTCATSALGGLASSVTMNMTGPAGSGWSGTDLNPGSYTSKPIGSYTLNSVSISDGTYRPSESCGYTNGLNNVTYPNPQTLTGAGTITFRGVFEISPPNAPSALSAIGDSCSQSSLNWTDNSSVETGFRIERKTGAGGTWAEIGTVGADTTTYLNPGLSESTDYYYRIRAYNSTGYSSYSNEASVSTPACPILIGTVNLDGYLVNASTCTESPLGSLSSSVDLNMTGPAGSSWSSTNLNPGSYVSKPIGEYTLNSVSVSDPAYRVSSSCGYTNGINNTSYPNPQTLAGGSSITFKAVVEEVPPPPSCVLVVSPTSLSFTDINQTVALTASGAIGTVSWSSGNVSIATVDPDSGSSTTVTSKTSLSENTTITATDSGVSGCSDSVSVTITSTVTPPIVPPVIVPSTPSGGGGGPSGGVRPTQARFSGQAYPGSKIEVLYRSNIDDMYKSTPVAFYSMSPEGVFETNLTALLGGNYLFALRAEDKDGRKTGVWSFKIDFLSTNDLVAENLFIPPTIGFSRNAIRKGDFVTIEGYAAPSSVMDIEIDGVSIGQDITAGYDGFYKALSGTADLSLGTHSARARQKNTAGKLSDYSQQVTFSVSKLFFPQTDLNSDGIIDIKDWSIFLSKWSSNDLAVRARLDFNGDGQVNLSDFSLFVRTLNNK